MQKLTGFAIIAAAVAVGIALAPFVGWVLLVGAAGYGIVLLWRRRHHSVVVIGGGVLVLAILLAWPIWLWRSEHDPVNAVGALVIVLLVGFWRFITAWFRPYWLKVFPD